MWAKRSLLQRDDCLNSLKINADFHWMAWRQSIWRICEVHAQYAMITYCKGQALAETWCLISLLFTVQTSSQGLEFAKSLKLDCKRPIIFVTENNNANPVHGESFHATSTLRQAGGSTVCQCNPRLLRHTYNKSKEIIEWVPVYISRNPHRRRKTRGRRKRSWVTVILPKCRKPLYSPVIKVIKANRR